MLLRFLLKNVIRRAAIHFTLYGSSFKKYLLMFLNAWRKIFESLNPIYEKPKVLHFHVFGLMPNDTSILFNNPQEIPTNIKVGNWSICQKIWSKDVFSDCPYTVVLFVDYKLRHTWICMQVVMSYVYIALRKITRKTGAIKTWTFLSLKHKLAFY